MRIHLRPYHPTYVISYLGANLQEKNKGFNTVLDKVRSDPEVEVELVEEVEIT